MNWYLPITIIPGIGMLIMSTVTQMLSISSEINGLVTQKCTDFQREIANRKINQLGLLTRASALLYLATGSYVFSGMMAVTLDNESHLSLPSLVLYLGTLFVFIALALLIVYAFRAVNIRRDQFTNNPDDHKNM